MSHEPDDSWIDRAIEADPAEPDFDEFGDPSGPPLSSEEIEAARSNLICWQPPELFKLQVDTFCGRCSSADWFNRPQLKFLHDAFVLARLAKHLSAEKVRLAEPSAQWPDGFLQLEGKTHNIEVTSTHGGRKLGAEYRDLVGLAAEEDPLKNWVFRAESIPKYLDEAIGIKRSKCYGAPCWLVVYLNISEWGIRQKQIEAVIAEVKARYAASFEAISVLWKGRFY